MFIVACVVATLVGCGIDRVESSPPTSSEAIDPPGSSTTTTETARPTVSTPTTDRPTTTSTTRPDRDELEADLRLVADLWADFDSSWDESVDAGFTFLEEHAYPELGVTAEACRIAFNVGPPDTFREDIVLDESTVEPDGDWVMPKGPLQGEAPDGRVYVMSLESQQYLNDELISSTEADVHVTVVDDRAYFFYSCGETV